MLKRVLNVKITLREVINIISALGPFSAWSTSWGGVLKGADVRAATGLWGAFEDTGPPHLISRRFEESDNDFGPGCTSPGCSGMIGNIISQKHSRRVVLLWGI